MNRLNSNSTGRFSLSFIVLVAFAGLAFSQEPVATGHAVVLDASSFWRVQEGYALPLAKTAEGTVEIPKGKDRNDCVCKGAKFKFVTVYPADGWTGVDFDDSSWARRYFFAHYSNGETDLRAGGGGPTVFLRQQALRGKFSISDPAKAGELKLELAYRGGAVVYVNGKELARANMPAGEVKPGSAAEIYADGVYLKDDGKLWSWYTDAKEIGPAYAQRVRKLEAAVPASMLRAGVNVLAIELHAAPYPEACIKQGQAWSTVGLIDLKLTASSAEAVQPNLRRQAGLRAWNTNVVEHVYDVEYGDPQEKLRPVVLAGARNGCFSGRVVVSSDQPIRGLSAKLSDLATVEGKKIAASAVQVGFGVFDHPQGARWGGQTEMGSVLYPMHSSKRDEGIIASPPTEVPVWKFSGDPNYLKGIVASRQKEGLPPLEPGAMQSMWLLANVPADAPAGQYKATLSVSAEGEKPIDVPVELNVADWTLPAPKDFTYFCGMIQCPEATALRYEVPLWSDKHWEYIGKSLELVALTGGKVLYLPLTAESQYGNSQSLVRWIKGEGQSYTHDFSVLEKHVDLAVKKMGPPRFVVVGVWDSCMHVSVPREQKRDWPRVSVMDKDGKVENIDGPRHGTPEALEFWKPVLSRVQKLLADRGLDKHMLLGYVADQHPTKPTVGVFRQILPDVCWQATMHDPIRGWDVAYEGGSVPLRYQANVWGGWDNHDPDCQRPRGWAFDVSRCFRTWLDRDMCDTSPAAQFRIACEQYLLANRPGVGQVGADFWAVKIGKDKDGRDRWEHTMVGRYPATNEGNLGIYAGQLLYPGPDGPTLTPRYQMMRENVQECEARIYLERLLAAKPCPLAEELAKTCQDVIDERTRWHRMQGFSSIAWAASGWEARSAKLFAAAAEASKAVATSRPAK